MKASFFRLEILFPGLLIARFVWARHKPIPAISIHMRLNMASW